jgi:hypothetical protein
MGFHFGIGGVEDGQALALAGPECQLLMEGTPAGESMPLDPDYDERAIYTVWGEVEIAGDTFGPR